VIGRRPSTAKAWSCSGSWTLFPVVLQWLENRKSDTKPILLDWLSAQLPGASISLGTSAETAAALRRQYTEPMETGPLTTAVRGKSPGSRYSSPQTARRSWRGLLGGASFLDGRKLRGGRLVNSGLIVIHTAAVLLSLEKHDHQTGRSPDRAPTQSRPPPPPSNLPGPAVPPFPVISGSAISAHS